MANNITSERMRLDMSQGDVAKEIGVSVSTVSRWERGILHPCGSELIKLHDLFRCSTDYLLGITNERNHVRV